MIKRKLNKRVCLLIGSFFVFHNGTAQNQNYADSLKLILSTNNSLTQEEHFQLLRGISEESTRPEEAIQYADKLILKALKDSNSIWLYRGYVQKGSALRLQGKLDQAIAEYFKSAEAAKRANYLAGTGGALLSIGDTYDMNGDHINSIKYANQAIKVLRQTSDSVTLAAALMNTGYGYYLTEQFDSALIYYGESGKIYEAKNSVLGKAYNLGNTGLVYAQLGNTTKAEEQLIEAIQILTKLEDSYAITEFQIEMADIYIQRSDFYVARKYLIEALHYSVEDGLQERIRDASLKLSVLYDSLQDYKKSHHYLKQYIAFRDSINNEETIRRMADLRTEFEVGQKQAEVDLLNTQARIQYIMLVSALVVLTLVFILAYVLYKLYRLRARAIGISRERRRVIAAQRNRLEALNHTKDRFFSIISHDIRGPVSNFHGVAQLIKFYVESGETDELDRVAEMLNKSSQELSGLLDNLLDWAMNQQGQFPYKLESIDLIDLCESNLVMIENMALAKEISIHKDMKRKVLIGADRNSVSTIIRNLLGNALKFTEQGGTIRLSLGSQDGFAVMSIADDGIGIPKAKQETLFGFKGERSRWGTSGEKGVGLGLNLVYDFVQLNKGKIEVDSEEGVGSTFRVYLPLAEIDEE